jgi:hypothetical protein
VVVAVGGAQRFSRHGVVTCRVEEMMSAKPGLLLACAAVALFLPTTPGPRAADAFPAADMGENPVHRQRIDDFVRTLRGEQLDQSISNLVTTNWQYDYPGFHTGRAFAQVNLEQMLSNRRSVKVLQSIDSLPQEQKEAICRSLFAVAFQVHTNALRMICDQIENPSAPTNRQSFRVTQIAMGTAMLAAADNGLKAVLSQQFEQLDSLRKTTEMHADALGNPRVLRFLLESHLVPDNRLQVNVLRLLAAQTEAGQGSTVLAKVEDECRKANMITNPPLSLSRWDARTTYFEELLVVSPGDKDTSVKVYHFLDWRDTEDLLDLAGKQADLVNRLRGLVFSR